MIVISAGHYPTAPGACWDGVCEHELAVQWARWIYDELSFRTEVKLAPVGKLGYKVAQINEMNADLAMEIHFNSAGGHGAGCETLYMPGSQKGKLVADIINPVLAQYTSPNRGVKEGWFRMDRPGIKDYPGDVDGDENPDYFLRKTNCPAVIIEPEFIHNYYKIEPEAENICQVLAGQLMLACEALEDAV